MRRRVPRTTVRSATVAVAALTAGVALAASGPVSAQPATPGAAKADASAQYEILDARTSAQRNAIASTGAAID